MVLHDIHSMYKMFHYFCNINASRKLINRINLNTPICNIYSRLINNIHPSRTTCLIYTKP